MTKPKTPPGCCGEELRDYFHVNYRAEFDEWLCWSCWLEARGL